jgi:hypothetical protein
MQCVDKKGHIRTNLKSCKIRLLSSDQLHKLNLPSIVHYFANTTWSWTKLPLKEMKCQEPNQTNTKKPMELKMLHYKDLGVLFDKNLTNHCQLSCQLGDPDSVT